MEAFIGTGAALVTPFTDQNQIDFTALDQLLQHTSVLDYWVVMGTTAESATLSKHEKLQVLSFIKERAQGKPIMYGVGSNNTQEVIQQLIDTDFEGIDAILSVCPYYVKPSQQGIIAHYQAIADASPVPVLLYNVPGRTGVNMTADTIIELSTHPNIFGVKDASGDLVQAMKIVNGTEDDFLLISGEDTLTVPMISVGCKGVISVIANVLPEEYKNVNDLALEGHFTEASAAMAPILSFNEMLFDEGNPVGVKTALEIAEIGKRNVRLPLVSGSESLKMNLLKHYYEIKLQSRKEVRTVSYRSLQAI